MSLAPYQGFFIVENDTQGSPRGVDKTLNGVFYCDKRQADIDLSTADPTLAKSFAVVSVVVMGEAEFARDYNPRQELPLEPLVHQQDDGMWKVLDQKNTPFWWALFTTLEDLNAAWAAYLATR